MDLFITTFESVAILLGIGLIGFFIIKRKIIPENALSLLSPLALDIALPSLIFVNIISNFSSENIPDWWQMPLWWIFFMVVAAGLTFLFKFISKKETRSEFSITLFFQNGIFFPLAILSGMFGAESKYLIYLFFFTLFYPAFFFNTYWLFFGKKIRELDYKKIFNIVLIATILALVISLANLKDYIPMIGTEILSLLGGMAVPLIMLIIGASIYIEFKKKGKVYYTEIIKFIIIKNIIFPLLFISIVYFLHPAYHIALILVIQAAVPPVTAVPIFTEKAGGNQSIVNQFLVSSFIFSLLTIPIMILVFNHIY